MSKVDEETKLFIEISQQLGKLNGNMETVLNTLTDHNRRIANLEKQKGETLKDMTIQWLVKGLISAVVIIGSLTGASGLIAKVLGQ